MITKVPRLAIDGEVAAQEFDLAFSRRAPRLGCRPEENTDAGFIKALYVACAPLKSVLSRPILEQQAHFQDSSFRATYPDAMRRVVSVEGRAVGRIIVDWSRLNNSAGIDIAVLPEARATGAGLAMLRAWLAVSDARNQSAHISVIATNPARRLYVQLGFVAQGSTDDPSPIVEMVRAARP